MIISAFEVATNTSMNFIHYRMTNPKHSAQKQRKDGKETKDDNIIFFITKKTQRNDGRYLQSSLQTQVRQESAIYLVLILSLDSY